MKTLATLSKTEIKERSIMSGCKFNDLTIDEQNILYTATTIKDLYSKISDLINKYNEKVTISELKK